MDGRGRGGVNQDALSSCAVAGGGARVGRDLVRLDVLVLYRCLHGMLSPGYSRHVSVPPVSCYSAVWGCRAT